MNTDSVANFKIEYSFTDKSGNESTAIRNVFVRNPFNDSQPVFQNGAVDSTWINGINAYDQGIPGYGSCTNGNGCPNIKWVTTADSAEGRGNVLQVSHLDNDFDAGLFISSTSGIDLRGSEKTGLLQLDIKRESGSDPYVDIWADCGYPCAGGPARQGPFVTGEWTRIYIPITDILEGPTSRLDLEIVKAGLLFKAASGKDAVYRIDNVVWLCETTCEGDNTPHVPFDWTDTHEDSSFGFDAPTSYEGYALVWSDEFNGNLVNPANWKFDLGNGVDGWGNGELQHYRAENATVDNGLLAIEAQKHQPKLPGDISYTSSKLVTKDIFEFKYGRVDARAVAAKGQGLWSAIWMLGANHSIVGWPRSGEIDILDTIAGNRDGFPQEAMMVNNMYWNAGGSSPDAPYSLGSINQGGSAEYWLNEPTDESYTRSLQWDVDNLPEWMAGPKLDNPETVDEEEIRPLLLTGCEGDSCIDAEGNHKNPVDVDNLPTWITEDSEWINWQNGGGSVETFSNTFHVFSLIWTEDKIIFEVDGVKTNEIDIKGALEEHYRQTFFLILNVAVGGYWAKAPSATTAFSDGMLVDYVRVYQADSDGDGIADYDWDGETPLDPDSPFYNGPGNPSSSAPPIFSTEYDGMPATDTLLDLTAVYSSDPDSEIQPTVTNQGTTFNVPAIYFVDIDGDGMEDNPGADAGFAHNNQDSELKLYDWDGPGAGQAYLDAVQEDAMAAYALQAAGDAFILAPYNQYLEADFENAATWAKYSAEVLRDSTYYRNTLAFGSGGYVYFRGSVPSDENVDLFFKIDNYEIDPLSGEFAIDENGQTKLIDSFVTNDITIKGSEWGFYGVKVDTTAKQGNSIAMVINTPDTDVVITDIRVITTPARDEMVYGPYFFTNVFSGTTLGDDPDTTEVVEVNAALGTDGKLLGADNTWPEIAITNEGTTFLVPSAYFEDPDTDGVVNNPGAYSGFGLDAGAIPDLTQRPLTFGENGKITFTASVQAGSADVRFRLERIGSPNSFETEPSCTMAATTINGSSPTEYTVFIPVQGRRTFEHVVMYLDTSDTEVTISNIMMETSPVDPTAEPVDCGSDAALYGDKELDMTTPFGDATVDAGTDDQGNPIPLFRVDSAGTAGFAGYAVNGDGGPSLLELAPAAFGEAGQIIFTASIPAQQQSENAQSTIDLQFKLERESSETPDNCKTEPSYTTEVITVSGAEQEYTLDIPEQGVNTFQSFIMTLLTVDTQVQISNIILTGTAPDLGVYVPPATCLASPLPSEYFDSSNSS